MVADLSRTALSPGPYGPCAFPTTPRGRTVGIMGIAAKHIDRLLPRHESPTTLDLSWNIRSERAGWFKKSDVISDPATILDISLEGALIAVSNQKEVEVGEHVKLRFRGLDGEAVVRHCRKGDDETRLYGVSFTRDPEFKDAIDRAVGEIRGHASELKQAWQRQN